MSSAPGIIFNEHRHALHMARAARAPELFLLREMQARLCDRLPDINRTFGRVLDISPAAGIGEYSEFDALVMQDTQQALAHAPESFDAVLSCGSLHWINDLPGMLIQIQRLLKPDGLFLCNLPGGETLFELRHAFEAAEMEITGGISPRVSPFVDIRDAGALLQRAGFALPVVDSESLEVRYDNAFLLMHDLRAMGQANALYAGRRHFTRRSVLMRMAEIYRERYGGDDGRIGATFELLTLTAWKPHASQPKPAKRGSGTVSLSVIE